MNKYIVRNHNGEVVYMGKSAAECAEEKRTYEIITGNLCTVEVERLPVKLFYGDFKNHLLSYANKFYNDAAEADREEQLMFTECTVALDNFEAFSQLYNAMYSIIDSDTTIGFVNSKGYFIDAANIHKDGDKSPREIIEGMTA